jgi:lysozyme
MPRKINEAGMRLIMQSEGCRLRAYPDPANAPPRGDGTPWTCGWGSTGTDIKEGVTWTQEQCDKRLMEDLAKFEKAVDELITYPLSSNQFSSVVCFVYNIGVGAFKKSTMLRLINSGDLVGASRQFALWVRANGRVMAGLVTRRQAEMNLFQRPDRG